MFRRYLEVVGGDGGGGDDEGHLGEGVLGVELLGLGEDRLSGHGGTLLNLKVLVQGLGSDDGSLLDALDRLELLLVGPDANDGDGLACIRAGGHYNLKVAALMLNVERLAGGRARLF